MRIPTRVQTVTMATTSTRATTVTVKVLYYILIEYFSVHDNESSTPNYYRPYSFCHLRYVCLKATNKNIKCNNYCGPVNLVIQPEYLRL